MTDDDATKLAALGKELPSIDLDSISAARIALRVRADVGKGPSPRRLVGPVLGGVAASAYAAWIVVKLVELLG